jgi:hypothetical protein
MPAALSLAGSGDTVVLPVGQYTGCGSTTGDTAVTIDGDIIGTALTIRGQGTKATRVNCQESGRALKIVSLNTRVDVRVEHMTILYGRKEGSALAGRGGAIRVEVVQPLSVVTFSHVNFFRNYALYVMW